MIDISTIARALEELDRNTPYAIAKAHDIMANLRRGGDIDLIVGDVSRARTALVAVFGPPSRESVSLYAHALHFSWGEVDLIDRVHWRGITLIDVDRVLSGRIIGPDGLFVTRSAHEMINACLYPKVSYGTYKDVYQDAFRRAMDFDLDESLECLKTALGSSAAKRISDEEDFRVIETRWLRRRILWSALADGKKAAAMLRYLRQRIGQPKASKMTNLESK